MDEERKEPKQNIEECFTRFEGAINFDGHYLLQARSSQATMDRWMGGGGFWLIEADEEGVTEKAGDFAGP